MQLQIFQDMQSSARQVGDGGERKNICMQKIWNSLKYLNITRLLDGNACWKAVKYLSSERNSDVNKETPSNVTLFTENVLDS